MTSDRSLFQQFSQRYKAGLQAQPEWVRNLHTAPSNLVADIISLPALPSDIAMLVGALSGNETALRVSDALAPGWVNSLRDVSGEIRTSATELAGVEPAIQVGADGTLDIDVMRLLQQEGPGALIPLGAGAKATQTTTKLGKAGQLAKELAIPGVQGKYAIGAPIQLAATVGGPLAIDAALEASGANLTGEEAEPFFTDTPAEPDPFFPVEAKPEPFFSEGKAELFFDPKEVQDKQDGWSLKNTLWTGLAAVTGVAGMALAGSTRNAARQARREASSVLTGAAEKADEVPVSSTQTTIRDLKGPVTDTKTAGSIQFANRYAALENALEKAETPNSDLFRAQLTTTGSNDALGSRMKHAFLTGQLPNTNIRTTQMANHFDQLAKLSPEQQALYDDALVAGTKIDQMLREQNNVWGNKTYQDLDAIRQSAKADPKVAPLVEEARRFYHDMIRYAVDRGTISAQKAQELRIQNPNFVPTRLGVEAAEDSVLNIFKATEPEMRVSNNLFEKRADLAEGVQPGEVVPPSKMHTSYMSRLMRYTENNALRRNFIDQMLDPGAKKLRTDKGQPVIEKVAKPGDNTVTIIRNGVQEHYAVRDNGIWSALQFTPNATPRINNWFDKLRAGTARTVVEGSTGVANPFFAPTSAWYDVASTFPTTPKGRALGPLDEILGRFSDGKVRLGNFDFSALASPITGTMKSYNAKMKLAFSQSLDASLRNDGFLVQTLGEAETARLRDVMLRAYENSSYGIHQRFGGGSFGALDAIHDVNADDILKAISPEYVRGTSKSWLDNVQTHGLSRAYVNALHTIKASNRMQFTGANIRRNLKGDVLSSDEELMKIVSDSRRIGGGDLGVKGGDPNTAAGRAWQQYLAEVPYLNTAIQEPRALINAIKNNPRAVATTMMAMGGASLLAVAEQLQDPEFREFYVNELTPQQRARTLFAQLEPGTRQPVAAAQITPFMRPFWSMVIESYLTMGGYKNGFPDEQAAAVQQNLLDTLRSSWGQRDLEDLAQGTLGIAASDVALNPIPPWAAAGLSGYAAMTSINDPAQETFALNELGGQRFSQTTVFGDQDPAVYRNMEKMLDNILGAASTTVVDSIHAMNISQKNNASMGKTLDNMSEAMTDRFKQPTSAGLGSSMWGVDMRLSLSGGASTLFHEKSKNARDIAAAFNSGVLAPGLTSMTEGRPLVQGGENLQGTELERYGMAAKELNKVLEEQIMPEYRALRKEVDAMAKRPGYIKPDAKHPTRNEYIASMKDLEIRALEAMEEIEELYGVDFRKSVSELSAPSGSP